MNIDGRVLMAQDRRPSVFKHGPFSTETVVVQCGGYLRFEAPGDMGVEVAAGWSGFSPLSGDAAPPDMLE